MKSKLHFQPSPPRKSSNLLESLIKAQKENRFLKESYKKRFSAQDIERIVIEGQSGSSSIAEICKRENITPSTFYEWSQDFIGKNLPDSKIDKIHKRDDGDKFRIVLEGLNGEFSVAEICRREKITHEEFLAWSRNFLEVRNQEAKKDLQVGKELRERKSILINSFGHEVVDFFESYINLQSSNTQLFETELKDFSQINLKQKNAVVCLYKMNDLRFINKHFENFNEQMRVGDVLIGCLETFNARKQRIWVNRIPGINNIYFGGEFLVKRVLPKLKATQKVYFNLSKGKDRLLSKAEGLGRLVCCGFKIMDHKTINGLVYFVVQKERSPMYDLNPSYGPFYAMPRLGKKGKIIKIYKLRTMHPYSEYLQDYIVKANGYAETGKPANDFRIPEWGKVMRRCWLDELPQLINFLKGDLKLVGIRPVSERYFQDIPKEMQKLRLTQKPGCIPPYVALNRSGNVMSVLQAEKEYLEEKIRNPYTTDTKYFFKALFNIVFMHKRSA